VRYPSASFARITIRPTQGWVGLNLRELLAYRDLIFFFIWRDIKVRYRQTLLGASWAVIKPVATMIVFTVIFGRLAGMPSNGLPYPVFCFTGLVLWGFFTQAITNASTSVVSNAQLVEKIYFPRMVIPIAASLAALPDFLLSFALLFLVMAAYGFYPGLNGVLCVPIIIAVLALAIGIGSGFAALAVRFRDVGHLLPFLIQLWLFATPVIYPIALLPERWRPLAGLNPLVGLIEAFRWALLGVGGDFWVILLISLLSTAILVTAGLVVFRRMERSFADII
jgi:lipopolysaccharide transport system permease protein